VPRIGFGSREDAKTRKGRQAHGFMGGHGPRPASGESDRNRQLPSPFFAPFAASREAIPRPPPALAHAKTRRREGEPASGMFAWEGVRTPSWIGAATAGGAWTTGSRRGADASGVPFPAFLRALRGFA
jgi:hypothetical protein